MTSPESPRPELASYEPLPGSKPVSKLSSRAGSQPDTPPLAAPRLWWFAGWAFLLFILYSTLAPSQDVPNLHLWDKLEHAGAFFGLTLWFGGLTRRSRYALLAFWMLLLGGVIELAQGYMGLGRDMDIHDFYADAIGVGVAFVLLLGAGLSNWAVYAERILGIAREPS